MAVASLEGIVVYDLFGVWTIGKGVTRVHTLLPGVGFGAVSIFFSFYVSFLTVISGPQRLSLRNYLLISQGPLPDGRR